jgi:hypothetical protein
MSTSVNGDRGAVTLTPPPAVAEGGVRLYMGEGTSVLSESGCMRLRVAAEGREDDAEGPMSDGEEKEKEVPVAVPSPLVEVMSEGRNGA